MKVDRLVLESFGAFAGVTVEFAPGLNLFFGENEDGKSTLIDALLLTLLGAPANAERRQRYAPLGREDYRAVVYFTTAAGRVIRFERDLAPGGKDKAGVREGDTWVAGRKSDAVLKDLALPSFDLARATVVISGSEVILAAKDAGAVSKAISARATGDETAVTGQQALRRLNERRVLLENKERRALEDELAGLRREESELASARAMGDELGARRKEAAERLAAARGLTARHGPAIEAFDRMMQARQGYEGAAKRHAGVFADLRAVKAREEEIARIGQQLSPLLPWVPALAGEAAERCQKLAGSVLARNEAAAQNEEAVGRLQQDLALLREKLALHQRAGFTLQRQRELDRLSGAVEMARKNQAEKEAALFKSKAPGAWSVCGLILAALAVLAGLALGIRGIAPGWPLAGLGLAAIVYLLFRRGRISERTRALTEARAKAGKEAELARASFLARSGNREIEAWQEEYDLTLALEAEIRQKEAEFQAKSWLSPNARAEEEELAALLAEAGCATPAEHEERAGTLREGQNRLEQAKEVRDSLMRGRTLADWEEEEMALARDEATARAAMAQAEAAAAGLEAALIARYREELAALDLPGLEREALSAAAAHEQHGASAQRRDPWEIETGLALAEQALARNRQRAEAIRLAMELLGQAVAEVQGNLVPRIESRAGQLFARLTGGRYDGLSVASGPEMLSVAPLRSGESLPARILSSGTMDQLYLALRLALTEALQGPEPFPLILDDPFFTFDRPRLGHALDLLRDLARTGQVILVTKDEVLRDLAAANGIRAERLPSRG